MRRNILIEIKLDIIANGGDSFLKAIRTVLFNVGFHTLLLYRLANRVNNVPIIGKIIRMLLELLANIYTGCYISHAAILGGGIRLPHPTGIVIGEGSKIAIGVAIYQQVTIGNLGLGNYDYPKINENVIIYAGAKVFGKINIGKNTIIGANAVVTKNIEANKTAVGIPAKEL